MKNKRRQERHRFSFYFLFGFIFRPLSVEFIKNANGPRRRRKLLTPAAIRTGTRPDSRNGFSEILGDSWRFSGIATFAPSSSRSPSTCTEFDFIRFHNKNLSQTGETFLRKWLPCLKSWLASWLAIEFITFSKINSKLNRIFIQCNVYKGFSEIVLRF